MSPPIVPDNSPRGGAALTPPAGEQPADTAVPAARACVPVIQAARAAPPADVLEQIGAAVRTHARMLGRGQELRFTLGEYPGGVSVELLDSASGHARALSVTQAVEMACDARAPERGL